jgi:heterodisulfide reductase subunit C
MTNSLDSWGFRPEKSKVIDLDISERKNYSKIVSKVPGLKACLYCGSCRSTCTVGNDGMNFRLLHILLQRGEHHKLKEILAPCLLCGKCMLVCPRNVDTRSVIYNLKIQLYEHF